MFSFEQMPQYKMHILEMLRAVQDMWEMMAGCSTEMITRVYRGMRR